MPDYAYIHKELQRSGVTLNLLWLEYCDQCRADGRGVLWRKPDLFPPQAVRKVQPAQHHSGTHASRPPEVCPVERRAVYPLSREGRKQYADRCSCINTPTIMSKYNTYPNNSISEFLFSQKAV